jgi:hypothetical protein
MKKFWKLILDLFNSEDSDAKNESFALLTQFFDLFFDPNYIDLRLNEQFWIIIQVIIIISHLQSGLLDSIPFNSKRCIFLIKKVIETTKNEKKIETKNWTKCKMKFESYDRFPMEY